MFILTDNNDILLAIGNEVINDTNEAGVVWINGAGYGITGQKIYEINELPSYVTIDKYKYINGEFVVNEAYSNPDEDLWKLKSDVNLLEGTISELTQIIAIMQGGN